MKCRQSSQSNRILCSESVVEINLRPIQLPFKNGVLYEILTPLLKFQRYCYTFDNIQINTLYCHLALFSVTLFFPLVLFVVGCLVSFSARCINLYTHLATQHQYLF